MTKQARLSYFDFTGLAEPCRYMLAYGNENFIDERMTGEQFMAKKQSYPFGKVPYLEIDGLGLHQSMSICRYLAKKYGVLGKTDADAVAADMMVDTINDVRSGLAKYHYEKVPEIKESKKEQIFKDTNGYLDKLEKIVGENNGYLVKGQMTWADIVFAGLEPYLSIMAGSDITANHPALKALKEKVNSQSGIKKYLDSRKK